MVSNSVARMDFVALQEECALPAGANQFAVVTTGDAHIGAHSMYKGIAIGGTLTDSTPNEDATVDATMSYINAINGEFRSNFNGGKTIGPTSIPSDMQPRFEYLAMNAVSSESGQFKVVVYNSGGTYSLDDFRGPDGQGEDNGNTLAIFNTNQDIHITKNQYSRQFGPTIIAPFATVIVEDGTGGLLLLHFPVPCCCYLLPFSPSHYSFVWIESPCS